MKKYIKPEMDIVNVNVEQPMLTGNEGGVKNDNNVGNKYNSTDVTYSRDFDDWDE